MNNNEKDDNPVLQFHINGSAVMITFSNIETSDIKAIIRDILTESYEERIQNTVQTYTQPL